MCIDNINTGVDINFAQNIRYEKELPQFSKITKSCVNLEDTTEDLYKLIEEIKEDTPENLITRLEALEFNYNNLLTEINALKNKNACDLDVSSCFNPTEQDPCGQTITKLGQALNYLDNK